MQAPVPSQGNGASRLASVKVSAEMTLGKIVLVLKNMTRSTL